MPRPRLTRLGSVGCIASKFETTIDNNLACGVDRDPFGNKIEKPTRVRAAIALGRSISERRLQVENDIAPSPSAGVPSFFDERMLLPSPICLAKDLAYKAMLRRLNDDDDDTDEEEELRMAREKLTPVVKPKPKVVLTKKASSVVRKLLEDTSLADVSLASTASLTAHTEDDEEEEEALLVHARVPTSLTDPVYPKQPMLQSYRNPTIASETKEPKSRPSMQKKQSSRRLKRKKRASRPAIAATEVDKSSVLDILDEEEEEIRKLQQHIADLELRQKQTKEAEEKALQEVELKKTETMRSFHVRRSRRHSMGSTDTSACVLRTMQITQQSAPRQQKMIEELRQSNKQLRREMFKMAGTIPLMQQKQESMKSELAFTQKCYREMKEQYLEEKEVYEKYYKNVMPRFEQSLQKAVAKVDKYEGWVQFEKKVKSAYDMCLKQLLSRVKQSSKEDLKHAVAETCSRLALAA